MTGLKNILRNFWLVIKSWVESNYVDKDSLDAKIEEKFDELVQSKLNAEYVSDTGTIRLSVDNFIYDDTTGYIKFIKSEDINNG